jgi:RHS repeat-associated protein
MFGNPVNASLIYANYPNEIGNKNYELSNHLGNVLSVITDRKIVQFGLKKDLIYKGFEKFKEDGDKAYINGELQCVNVFNGTGTQLPMEFEGSQQYYVVTHVNLDDYHSAVNILVEDFNGNNFYSNTITETGDVTFTFSVPSNGEYRIRFLKNNLENPNDDNEEAFYIKHFELFILKQTDEVEGFLPDVIAYNDYYPFGSLLPKRHGSSDDYRYGFQGQEKDDEIKDSPGSSINYKYRMHDPRVGRFFAMDPLVKKYPWYSPYQFSGNTPIMSTELEGLEPRVKNGVLVGYTVMAGQGPSQISLDINDPDTQKEYGYTLQKPVTWRKVVMDNVVYYAKAGGIDEWNGTNMLDIDNPVYKNLNSNPGDILEVNLISADSEKTLPPIPIQEDERYGGAGLFEYTDEILAGADAYTKGLKNGGGYIAYSKAKSGKGLYWKPDTRGLNNMKGGVANVNSIFKYGGPIIGTVLEVPEIVDGYKQNSHEGNKQVAGAVGSVGGGWLGGVAAGAGMGLLGIETGPGVVITVIGGAIIGGFVGEEGMERLYEEGLPEYTGSTTCFVAGTKIEMADGSFKNIEDVVAGDKILSVDINTMKLESDLVLEIPQKVKKYKRIKIVIEDNTTIECSPAHPIWVKEKGWSVFSREEAKKELTFNVNVLEENDVILKNVNGKLVELKIRTITDTGEFIEMYNVEFVKKNNTFFANGVLVHNKRGAIND